MGFAKNREKVYEVELTVLRSKVNVGSKLITNLPISDLK